MGRMTPNAMIEELLDLGNLTREEAAYIILLSGKLQWGAELTDLELRRLQAVYNARV